MNTKPPNDFDGMFRQAVADAFVHGLGHRCPECKAKQTHPGLCAECLDTIMEEIDGKRSTHNLN